MKACQKNKEQIRDCFLKVRKEIDPIRRQEAKQALMSYLKERLADKQSVLSYYSTSDEVDMIEINEELAARKVLALPRMENNSIVAYKVKNLPTDLHRQSKRFLEPIPERCEKIELFDLILIPAVAFDLNRNRIGYGYGHYDQFLKGKGKIHKIGIAFKEQISANFFPVEEHDVPVDEICIV